MNASDFAFWLNGFFELSDAQSLDAKQIQIVKDHLKLVFDKVTPNRDYYAPLNVDCDGYVDVRHSTYEKFMPSYAPIDPSTVAKTC